MSSKVRLYNTMSRQVEEFHPIDPQLVRIYCCGPTVYDFATIGNFRTYLNEDMLVRTLRFADYKVKHVMNITDVGHLVGDADEGEDKMMVAAKREKKTADQIAAYYTDIFFNDWDKLNISRPDIVCPATKHIQEMIDLIKRLEAQGLTYVAGGNVYFDVSKLQDYGKLARLDLDKLVAGTTVAVDTNKRGPFDFVLWFTKSKFEGQEQQWDSPWGRGYPGWHIECSAMSMKYLGEQFDIHCGGIDHVNVHHTNEIAQSEGAIQKPWVNYWMHMEFLMVDGEKMSKSKGNFTTISTLIERGLEPLAFRFFCLGTHYKKPINFTNESIGGAQTALKKLRVIVLGLKTACAGTIGNVDEKSMTAFKSAVFNDLNMPLALGVLWNMLDDPHLSAADKYQTALQFDQVLGLNMAKWVEERVEVPAEVEALVQQRIDAKRARDFKEADRLRDQIFALGFVVEDGAQGAKVRKK